MGATPKTGFGVSPVVFVERQSGQAAPHSDALARSRQFLWKSCLQHGATKAPPRADGVGGGGCAVGDGWSGCRRRSFTGERQIEQTGSERLERLTERDARALPAGMHIAGVSGGAASGSGTSGIAGVSGGAASGCGSASDTASQWSSGLVEIGDCMDINNSSALLSRRLLTRSALRAPIVGVAIASGEAIFRMPSRDRCRRQEV